MFQRIEEYKRKIGESYTTPKKRLRGYEKVSSKLDDAVEKLLPEWERKLQHKITRGVLLFPLSTGYLSASLRKELDLPSQREFLSTLRQDDDLRNYMETELESLEKQQAESLENLRSLRQTWENL